MTDDLVTWNAEGVAEWARARGRNPGVLVQSLRGFIDAGHAGQLVARHLIEESQPVRVATFDIDRLLDYRSRRPEMVFDVNEWTSYDEPYLQVDMVKDSAGEPFLLLHGFEPDVLWEKYIADVRSLVERLGVDMTIGAHGIPMAAPHTRKLGATVHGTKPELLPASPSFFATVTVPASAQNLLEYRFGQEGLAAANVAVHVPHYLAQSHYPQAAAYALEKLAEISGLAFDTAGLADAIARADEEIARQLEESDEIQSLVAALEEQHDDFMASRDGVLPADGMIPSAEELGAEFEQYLADRGNDYPGSA